MIRTFEEVSVRHQGVLVGRFAGRVHFEFVDGDAHVAKIELADEERDDSFIALDDRTETFIGRALYHMLVPQLLTRFARDLMTTLDHVRRVERQPVAMLETHVP